MTDTSIKLRDGIVIRLNSGERIVADGSAPDGDLNVLSHAHGDHLYSEPPTSVICSETTAALAAARRAEISRPTVVEHPRVELLKAGHIPGSRAALLSGDTTSVLYTGDISTRDRFYLEGFDPVSADILVIEATYGKPEYDLPDQKETEAEFVEWLNETRESPVIAFGYTLGRAQELIKLGERSDRDRVYVTDAIASLNEVITEECGVTFDTEEYRQETTLEAGDLLVLPAQTNRLAFVDQIVDETGAIKVGVSGWAVDSSYKFRGGYDVTFPLSDHCDFGELLAVVDQVDPEQVYTNHGFAVDLAREITQRRGYPAQALKQNQTTLSDF